MFARSPSFLVVILAAFGLGIPAAWCSEPSPTEILERMEIVNNGYDDQTMDVTMTVVDTNGGRKSYDFTIWQKGAEKRLIRFHSGEMKGTATLIESRDRVSVYLPGFRKVRRVAAHNMTQSFAGSDFSNDDMAAVSWAEAYDVSLERTEPDAWHLIAVPKPGIKTPYAKVRLMVDRTHYYQNGVDYFGPDERVLKRMRNSKPINFGGTLRYSLVVMEDARTGHRTELAIRDFRVNEGLKDSLFTVRELEWAR
jgi:outer membrane lipoprotein-sorting protein